MKKRKKEQSDFKTNTPNCENNVLNINQLDNAPTSINSTEVDANQTEDDQKENFDHYNWWTAK